MAHYLRQFLQFLTAQVVHEIMLPITSEKSLLALFNETCGHDWQVLNVDLLDNVRRWHRDQFGFSIHTSRDQYVLRRMPREIVQHRLVVVSCVGILEFFEI